MNFEPCAQHPEAGAIWRTNNASHEPRCARCGTTLGQPAPRILIVAANGAGQVMRILRTITAGGRIVE